MTWNLVSLALEILANDTRWLGEVVVVGKVVVAVVVDFGNVAMSLWHRGIEGEEEE